MSHALASFVDHIVIISGYRHVECNSVTNNYMFSMLCRFLLVLSFPFIQGSPDAVREKEKEPEFYYILMNADADAEKG